MLTICIYNSFKKLSYIYGSPYNLVRSSLITCTAGCKFELKLVCGTKIKKSMGSKGKINR